MGMAAITIDVDGHGLVSNGLMEMVPRSCGVLVQVGRCREHFE